MAQTVSGRPLNAEARVLACICPRGICGGQSVINPTSTKLSANPDL
jgi:hypothetical protein